MSGGSICCEEKQSKERSWIMEGVQGRPSSDGRPEERPEERESGKGALGKGGGVQRGSNTPAGTSEKLQNKASVGGTE